MKTYPTLNECRGYVAAHLHANKSAKHTNKKTPAITISRQAGARGITIGHKLQNALRAEAPKAAIPWTLFDENLVTQVLEDHNLPIELEKFMPDDAMSEIEGSINEILGRHPSLWSLFEKTARTVVRLTNMGHCIVVGRGGNKIVEGFAHVLRVRLIGSDACRARQMVNIHGMSEAGAHKYIKEEDTAREAYMRQHFHCDIDDPLDYDLIINTDHLNDDQVVQLLVDTIKAKA